VIPVRSPAARRPWQHVLEPLSGYLRLAGAMMGGQDLLNPYNFCHKIKYVRPVVDLVKASLTHWPGTWEDQSDPNARHEAGLLSLDIQNARADLGYAPRWDFAASVKRSIEWYRAVSEGASARDTTLAQIRAFGAP